MTRFCARLAAMVWIGAAVSGCVTTTLAPGADHVKLTQNASEVAACTATGNITVPRDASGQLDVANAEADVRNQAIGFGANAVLVTGSRVGVPATGVAYRCP